MKQKDIALIIVIAFFSAVVSFLVSNRLFITPDNREQKAEIVDPINASFDPPSKKYFNPNSINPAQPTALSSDNNQNPFSGGGN